MSSVVTPMLEWLNQNPQWAGLATFVISAGESVAIVGTIVPGTVTMTAIGALAGAGIIPLWSTMIWAILGAIVGDGISYWIGHYFKDRIRRMWPFRDNPGVLEKGEAFVHKYGVASVFIGRFVGPVRALVPVVAGMLGMKPIQFTIANVTSAIGWAPAYMLPGILLGAASQELPPGIAMHVILNFILIILLIALCIWLLVKIIQFAHKQIDHMQDKLWRYMKSSNILFPITVLLKHHDPKRKHGHLNLALYFLIASVSFLTLAFYVKVVGPQSITLNDAAFHLTRGIRGPALDSIMLNITMLGQKQVIYAVILVIFGYLLYSKHFREAWHAFMLTIFAMGGVFVFKHLLEIARPWGILNGPTSYSMPSGHTVLSTTLYMGMAFLVATSMRSGFYKRLVYLTALLVTVSVGISRVYLSAHWLTDVIAGWLFGASVLCFVIISYERDVEKRVNPAQIFIFFFVTLAASFGVYHHLNYQTLKHNYAMVDWPVKSIEIKKWWANDHEIPEYFTSLFGFKSEQINIQWLGRMSDIKQTLKNNDWVAPPARDWISSVHRVADISSTQYLPMISPHYQDKRPQLILTKPGKDKKHLMVLRMWESSRYTNQPQLPLWVGIISYVPSTFNWISRKHNTSITIEPQLLLPTSSGNKWRYKLLDITAKLNSKHSSTERTILIRP